jgi:hypothetical protein
VKCFSFDRSFERIQSLRIGTTSRSSLSALVLGVTSAALSQPSLLIFGSIGNSFPNEVYERL